MISIARMRPCKQCGRQRPARNGAYCCGTCRTTGNHANRERIRKPRARSCPICGVQFTSFQNKKKYCSHICKARRLTYSCHGCGNNYNPKAHNRKTYCSRGCAFAAKKRVGLERQALRRIQRANDPNSTVKCSFVCVDCGIELNAGKRCRPCNMSKARQYYHHRVPTHKQCQLCGEMFPVEIRDSGQRAGTNRCQPCRKNSAREYNRSRKSRRRARIRGNINVFISRVEIFKRDGYICQCCGNKTRHDYKTTHPLFPELDHIIPLSLGGPHVPSNVQCLCRRCNGKKGSTTVGQQLRLGVVGMKSLSTVCL